MKTKWAVLIAGSIFSFSLPVAQAVPIVITSDAELIAAHQSIPHSDDDFIKAIKAATEDGDTDIMSALFEVFKQSIADQNTDLENFLSQLQYMNEVSQAMAEYLRDLNEALLDGLGSAYVREGVGIDAGFEATEDQLLAALANSDEEDPIPVVGETTDDVGSVNALMRSYGISLKYVTATAVPEPISLFLMIFGLTGLFHMHKRNSNSATL